jgi:hypothetical protein
MPDKSARPSFKAPKTPTPPKELDPETVGAPDVIPENQEEDRPTLETVIESKPERPETSEIPADPSPDEPPRTIRMVSRKSSAAEQPTFTQLISGETTSQEPPKKDPPPPAKKPATTKPPKSDSGSGTNILLVGITIFSLIFGLSGWALYLNEQGSISFSLPTTGEAPTPTTDPEEASPTPTPAPELDRSEITIDVLNGSGITGKAGETAEKLETLGYTIGTIGNASATGTTTALPPPRPRNPRPNRRRPRKRIWRPRSLR